MDFRNMNFLEFHRKIKSFMQLNCLESTLPLFDNIMHELVWMLMFYFIILISLSTGLLSLIANLLTVQLLLEGQKNVWNLLYGFEIYLRNVKTMRKILQIFVAFSELLNFNIWITLFQFKIKLTYNETAFY